MKLLIDIIEGNKKIDSLDSMSDKLADHYPKTNELPHEEKRALDNYTTSSREINTYHWQRNNKVPKAYIPKKREAIEETSKNIDSSLSKNKTPHKLVVYSGTRIDPREHMDENKIVNHPAYLSTSLDKQKAYLFSKKHSSRDENDIIHRHMLKIHVPKGSNGMYVENNVGLRGEKELILPRDTKLRHIKTEKKEETLPEDKNYKTHTHLHHMELVNDK